MRSNCKTLRVSIRAPLFACPEGGPRECSRACKKSLDSRSIRGCGWGGGSRGGPGGVPGVPPSILWRPFSHRFFDIFRTWRNCIISEEYNVFRGSGPLKSERSSLQISLNFHVNFQTPPRGNFGRARMPI